MKTGRTLLAALVLAGTISVAACGDGGGDEVEAGGGGGDDRFDLTIGNIVPLTGVLRDFGPAGQKAATVALQQIQQGIQEAGVEQTVELKNEDERTDANAAEAAARKLVDGGAACIAGAWAAPDTTAVSQSVTTREKILQISPASTSSQITTLDDDGYLNRTAPPDSLQGPALANVMETELGGASGKIVNIGARNDPYGTSLAGFFEKAWTGKGGKIGQKVIYDPKQPSYNSEALKIGSGNPDAWVIVDFPDTYQKLGPALVRTGAWDPKKTFITDGLASSTLPEEVGAAATEGLRGTAPGTPQKGARQVLAFDRLYRAAPPKNVGRQTFDAQNFDAVILCYLAAVAAGEADGEAMKNELRDVAGPPGRKYTWQQLPALIKDLNDGKDVDYEGASGSLDLDENGDPTSGVYEILEFQNGMLTRVRQAPIEQGT
jgi:ABC-type branched-subunit amino acid transport system substrate-binding protein